VLVWVLLLLLLLALVILAVGALLVAGRPRRRSEIEQPLFQPSASSSAEQILAERLARGEIDGDEYRRRRDALRE
jgi:putative membrane protein